MTMRQKQRAAQDRPPRVSLAAPPQVARPPQTRQDEPNETSGKRPPMPPAQWRQGLIIVATMATAYMASHFFRAANVTIGLDLMRDLHLGPEALGALTGAFFFGFSTMQIPCGFFFD